MGPCRAPRADLSSWRTKDACLCVLGGGDVRLFGGKGDDGQLAGILGRLRPEFCILGGICDICKNETVRNPPIDPPVGRVVWHHAARAGREGGGLSCHSSADGCDGDRTVPPEGAGSDGFHRPGPVGSRSAPFAGRHSHGVRGQAHSGGPEGAGGRDAGLCQDVPRNSLSARSLRTRPL